MCAHGASDRACELDSRLTVTVRGLTSWLSLDPKGGLGRSVQSSSHERSSDAMTFDDSTSDDDVATDEHAIENHTSSRSSTCLVLAFVALAVVTLGALSCFQTDFPARANLDRASSTRRNASKRVTIATPLRALTRPSFAVCVVGQVRAMARRDVREHARAALTTPLVEDGGDVEVFLHLDAKGMDEIMETTLREFWSPTSLEVYEVENRGSLGRAVFERGVAADVSTTRVRGRRSSTRTNSKQNLRLDRFDETGHRVLRQTSTSARVDRAEEGFSLERNVLVDRRN